MLVRFMSIECRAELWDVLVSPSGAPSISICSSFRSGCCLWESLANRGCPLAMLMHKALESVRMAQVQLTDPLDSSMSRVLSAVKSIDQ